MIIQVENKPSQTIQILLLHSGHIEIFSKELTPDFGQRLKNYICLFLDKNTPRYNTMSDDHLVKKQVLLDYQTMDII